MMRRDEFLRTAPKYFIINGVEDKLGTENIYQMQRNLGPEGFIQCPFSDPKKNSISCLFGAKKQIRSR